MDLIPINIVGYYEILENFKIWLFEKFEEQYNGSTKDTYEFIKNYKFKDEQPNIDARIMLGVMSQTVMSRVYVHFTNGMTKTQYLEYLKQHKN